MNCVLIFYLRVRESQKTKDKSDQNLRTDNSVFCTLEIPYCVFKLDWFFWGLVFSFFWENTKKNVIWFPWDCLVV